MKVRNSKSQRKKIILKPVSKNDFSFLYNLLAQRSPITNISHKKMPTYREHIKFVNSKPYSKWYIISHNQKRVGSVYLTKQNEIGIHILAEYGKELMYLEVIKEIMIKDPRKHFLANVAPHNKKYIRFFKKLGFKMIQHTYELDKRPGY